MQTNEFAHYKRACVQHLARFGVEAFPEGTNTSSAADCGNIEGEPTTRFNVWLAESMLHGFRSVERGDMKQAFRAYGQVREYIGRLGGFDPLAYCDAASALKQAIEGRIS